ncbi:MAG: bacteriorhodopsin [Thermaceae bacterium]|nr:bacteriorhodopsin [Thermaceae bacterium]
MNLPEMSFGQYQLVYNVFSLTLALIGASAVFFLLARSYVAPRYHMALYISTIVVLIAAYHYLRIFNSWADAYTLKNGMYAATGIAFNDAYRYADWLATVPLLLTELILVLALSRERSSNLITKLVVAAVLMLALGYPGEIARDNPGIRALWGTLSTIPFLYILYVLWVELTKALETQPPRVQLLTRNMRLLLLASWGFYPIAYLFPIIGFTGAGAEVAVQVGYSVADILAKPFFGLLLFAIALEKTRAIGELEAKPAAQGTD